MSTNAYAAGRAARRQGWSLDDNPKKTGGAPGERLQWQRGWQDQDRAMKGNR